MKALLPALSLLMLSGCSIFSNTPYVFPEEHETRAALTYQTSGAKTFAVYNVDDGNCYKGFNYLPRSTTGKTVQIHAGKEIFMSMEEVTKHSTCRVVFSFIPEEGKNYLLRAGEFSKKNKKIEGFLGDILPEPGYRDYCTVSLAQRQEDDTVVAIKLTERTIAPTTLWCIKLL